MRTQTAVTKKLDTKNTENEKQKRTKVTKRNTDEKELNIINREKNGRTEMSKYVELATE